MELVANINSAINGFVWGPVMLSLLVGTGVIVTVGTKFFQVSKIAVWMKGTFGALRKKKESGVNISPFQAVTVALASTVGTGNIAGIATAIVAGGPGAVFWMWVSAFFGMMTKYAEVVLAIKYREVDDKGGHYGGPMYYLANGAKMKWLAILFSIFAVFASFGIGNMTQANSISNVLVANFGFSPLVVGIVLSLIVALVIIGGIKRIVLITEKLVPFMAILYIIGAVIVLIANCSQIPAAFGLIFDNAFTLRSGVGGVAGYTVMTAMRYGVARGVFSNEAGLGSAPIAHASSDSKNPVEQGLWGIFEVFVDTIIICSLTALAILTSGLHESGLNGAALTTSAFSSVLGNVGGLILSLSLMCFAFSTIIGWSHYGEYSLGFLLNNNVIASNIYKVVFSFSVILGCTLELTLVWDISDTLNGLMAIPNLIGILLLSKIIFSLTKSYLKDPRSTDL